MVMSLIACSCVTRQSLIDLIISEHERDHRQGEACYNTLRANYYPVVRDTVLALFKTNVNCTACHRQAPLPKTTLTRRTILATYPNSRWQMDLKKLPSVRGYEYCCNVVDCFSRFAMGGPIKSKSAKDVCNVIVSCMYRYGAPRILQTDNGREFNNSSLAAVMDEMRALKINGRPYHPQSQGRVERLNQTLANFLRRDLQKEPDWPSRLEYFYFTYNCRVHRSLKGKCPIEVYLRRPNFSIFVEPSRTQLTEDERQYLDEAHLDIDGDSDVDDSSVSSDVLGITGPAYDASHALGGTLAAASICEPELEVVDNVCGNALSTAGATSCAPNFELAADYDMDLEPLDSQTINTGNSYECGPHVPSTAISAACSDSATSCDQGRHAPTTAVSAASSTSPTSCDQDEAYGDAESYPVELQWANNPEGRTEQAKYAVGETVWFYRAANLGGAAGVAALRPQWREGVVVRHDMQEGGFLLYEVEADDGGAKASFAEAHLRPRHVSPVHVWHNQFLDPVPEDWYRGPEPYRGPARKRYYR
eukprot:scpid51373/ scgid5968/ Pol polyprotein; Reverse transcriptase/ribonuclease H; Integrase